MAAIFDLSTDKTFNTKYAPLGSLMDAGTDGSGNTVNDKHFTEWLSLKKGKEAKVKAHIEVVEKGDYIEFEANDHFTITPQKIEIKDKTGKNKLNDLISIKCNKEFTDDQEIKIKAYKQGQTKGALAGKINVWANHTSKHKQKKVVFVQIKTPPISSRFELESDASNEKTRINKYLEQAYIELHPDSVIVDLDLTTDVHFSRFVRNGKIKKVGDAIPAVAGKPAIPRQALISYLKEKLTAIDARYGGTDFFKAFYFAEHGYHPSGNVSGYSAFNADYVVVFKSANDQTAVHEFLHAFNLAHTFTNVEASANAEFTYKAKMTDNLLDYSHNIASDPNNSNRCSLYYWQWIKANKSIT